MLAVLLLLPALNTLLGEWTYGRWMMVHVNILLYGWCGLPMLGWLFRIYGADRGPAAGLVPSGSVDMVRCAASRLADMARGHSSGKLFLDWSGYSRFAFPAAMLGLPVAACRVVGLAWNSAA